MNTEFPLVPRSTAQVVGESMIFLTIDLLAFSGNLLVCLAMYRNPRLRTTTNIYITTLAVSDILNSLIVQPLTVGTIMTGRWVAGSYGLQGSRFLQSIFILRIYPNHDPHSRQQVFPRSQAKVLPQGLQQHQVHPLRSSVVVRHFANGLVAPDDRLVTVTCSSLTTQSAHRSSWMKLLLSPTKPYSSTLFQSQLWPSVTTMYPRPFGSTMPTWLLRSIELPWALRKSA